MRRNTITRPGYDCIGGPCRFSRPCQPDNTHGIHGDEWVYSIVSDDGATALVLTVFTDIYPATVSKARVRAFRTKPLADRRHGADLTLHMAVNDQSGRLVDAGEAKHDCEHVQGGQCYVWETTALGADELFRAFGNPAEREQPETFWRALEARFHDADRRIRFTFITTTEPPPQERHAGVGLIDLFEPGASPQPPARLIAALPSSDAPRRDLTYEQLEELRSRR